MLLFFSCQELVNNDQQRALTSRTPPRESSKSPTRAVSWVNRLFVARPIAPVSYRRTQLPERRSGPFGGRTPETAAACSQQPAWPWNHGSGRRFEKGGGRGCRQGESAQRNWWGYRRYGRGAGRYL